MEGKRKSRTMKKERGRENVEDKQPKGVAGRVGYLGKEVGQAVCCRLVPNGPAAPVHGAHRGMYAATCTLPIGCSWGLYGRPVRHLVAFISPLNSPSHYHPTLAHRSVVLDVVDHFFLFIISRSLLLLLPSPPPSTSPR